MKERKGTAFAYETKADVFQKGEYSIKHNKDGTITVVPKKSTKKK